MLSRFVMPAKAGIQYLQVYQRLSSLGLLDRPVKQGDDKEKRGLRKLGADRLDQVELLPREAAVIIGLPAEMAV